MSMPFLKPSRSVLLIGDEALCVYKVTSKVAKLVDVVQWEIDDFKDVVATLLKKECGGKPVLILNDMTDQHFKGGQRLPKVGQMDKANVLQRKLHIAFPTYPIRGALLTIPPEMKKEARTSAVRQQESMYLFAAVPMSEPVVKTFEAVKASMVSIAGFCLLPVESADMVKSLSEKLAGKKRAPSSWVIFLGQHRNGALRQVITRDGQLAMTRMTPVIADDSDPALWASEVSQELKATISYLSRFGYASHEGTDVIVVSGPEAGESLKKLVDIPCNYKSFTVMEAAKELGIGIGVQESVRYVDPLHVAWSGRKSRFTLLMDSVEISQTQKPRQYVVAAMLALVLSGGYLSWELMTESQKMLRTRNDLTTQKQTYTRIDTKYEKSLAAMEALGFDVKLIQGAISTYEGMEDKRMKTLPLIKKIGEALGDELRLDSLTINKEEDHAVTAFAGQGRERKKNNGAFEATLILSFPPSIDPEFGVKEINDFERRLKVLLPEDKISIERQVADLSYTGNFSGTATSNQEEASRKEDFIAEIMIRGAVK